MKIIEIHQDETQDKRPIKEICDEINRLAAPLGYVSHRIIQEDLCVILSRYTNSVEVVRCKDCKYFQDDVFANVDGIPIIVAHEICAFNVDNPNKVSENHYCGWGERKEK